MIFLGKDWPIQAFLLVIYVLIFSGNVRLDETIGPLHAIFVQICTDLTASFQFKSFE